ncbi:MAG: hypothetical protein HYT79_07245 [Elusimicrobia bacterium]|nr:hypothetical protein [Elusimicrobiota bacterium]
MRLPESNPKRQEIIDLYIALRLEARDRPRCDEYTRPFVASFDGDAVLICPWMTHLAVESMLTVLAHELGHAVDPCWLSDEPIGTLLPSLPPERAQSCVESEELFADRIGALLTGELLSRLGQAGIPNLVFPENSDERLGTFLFYAFTPACQIWNERLTALIYSAEIRSFTGCSQ